MQVWTGRQGAEDLCRAAAASEKKRGLKGKIAAKKTGEMKEELEAAVALVQQYVPPSPDLMQVVTERR